VPPIIFHPAEEGKGKKTCWEKGGKEAPLMFSFVVSLLGGGRKRRKGSEKGESIRAVSAASREKEEKRGSREGGGGDYNQSLDPEELEKGRRSVEGRSRIQTFIMSFPLSYGEGEEEKKEKKDAEGRERQPAFSIQGEEEREGTKCSQKN